MKYRLVDLIKDGIFIPDSVQKEVADCMAQVSMYGIFLVFPEDYCQPHFTFIKVDHSIIDIDLNYAEIVLEEYFE